MKLNDLSESRKMLKLLKENRQQEQKPPRSYSEFSKSPNEKKYSFEKAGNVTQQVGGAFDDCLERTDQPVGHVVPV